MAGKRHRLIQRRTMLGFTQERLAELLEVDVSSVQRWEAGGGIKPWMRPKLARPLKVSLDDLDEILADITEDKPAPDGRLAYAVHNPTAIAAVITTPTGAQQPQHARQGTGPGLDIDEAMLTLDSRDSRNEVALHATAGRFFAGTDITAIAFPAHDNGRILAAVPTGFAHDIFLRRPRRGLVIGVTPDEHHPGIFGMDTRQARRRLDGTSDHVPLLIPRAYVLDDLTLAILWAVANLDEALLDDDAPLNDSTGQLAPYERLPRSAAGRDIAADLAPASQMWLGSQFCANHILRHSESLMDVPTFWTREQRGEEASTWLLFAHKYTYLGHSGGPHRGHGSAPTRAFCVPPSAVTESSRLERILLLLAIALMESFGITVQVCVEPEYTAVPGFVFDGSRHAILANWVGTDGIWQVDVTDTTPLLRELADAAGYASAHSIATAHTPGERLQALADYLGLDWPWLTRRCTELGEYGTSGLAAPRSRLLSTAGIDRACRFLASVAHGAR